MNIGFIGAGKVGCSLGKYFSTNGLSVSGYYSQTVKSSLMAAKFTNTKQYDSIQEIVKDSDLLFLTVPDRFIELVWEIIRKLSIENKIICHCSGSLSSAIFSEIDQCKAFGYSIHPLFAVASKTDSYKEFSKVSFTIEGSVTRFDVIQTMFARLGNSTCVILTPDKVKYHAAATFLSNHVVALAQIGKEMLTQCGLLEEDIQGILKSLMVGNVNHIAEVGPKEALTGPIERNDWNTIKKHLLCLEVENQKIYKMLSRKLLKIAKEKHSERDYQEMEELLNNETYNNNYIGAKETKK